MYKDHAVTDLMTTSKYTESTTFVSAMPFNSLKEWLDFKYAITQGCHFEAPVHSNHATIRWYSFPICSFKARFHRVMPMFPEEPVLGFFHISNEDRRKIYKYLRDKGEL